MVKMSIMNVSQHDSPHPQRRSTLRRMAYTIAVGSLTAIAAVLALVAFLRRERLPPITMDDVDAAAKRWNTNGPADYNLDMELSGVNPGTVHVEVRHNEVVDMTLNGHTTRQHLWDDWSVPGLLAVVRRDVEVCMPAVNADAQKKDPNNPAPPVLPRGLFDPHYGYPSQYHRITPTGADAQWRATKFEPK